MTEDPRLPRPPRGDGLAARPVRVWLFVDWLEFSGAEPNRADAEKIAAAALEASRRDPYRQMSRVFHLIGRRNSA
jgi:hypothetical protein